jgi:hypothetical protein
VAPNTILVCQSGDLVNRIDDSVRIVRVGGIDSDGIAVNQRLHMGHISFILVVESGLTHFHVEVHSTLIQGGVDGIRGHTA